jgi:hypothetical protein
MPTTVLFEVHALRKGIWYIDSVHDDREHAVHEARELLDRRHQRGVKVIQENYDDEHDISVSRTIFTEVRGVDKPKYRRQNPGSPVRSAAPRKKKGDSDFVRYIVILVLSVGGILLTGIGLLAFLIIMFGGK